MKALKIILVICTIFLASGCVPDGEKQQRHQRQGEAREKLFKECLVLAANITQQSDDNVAEVIAECSSQAYYMTTYLQ